MDILTRGVEEIIVFEHLQKALQSGRKLRVKFGIDPTAPDLHLGHTVPLRKLKQFQEAGHKIILIIGDFTAQIGDPSGRSETRKPLTEREIKMNMKKYLPQAGKIIDLQKTEIYYNSKWHNQGLKPFLHLAKATSVQQILKRDDFKKRLQKDIEISLLETLYPLLQGYDSVMVKADVEIGGTDQKFNLLMGRRVQRYFGMKEQDIITVPLLEGTDGVLKMSKSYGNYIALNEKPNEMFGKIMSIPDDLIDKYFTLLTDLERPKNLGPREAKLTLAFEIVKLYHHEKAAQQARENWLKIFSKKEIPAEIPILKIKNKELKIMDVLLAAGVASKSEARRLLKQKAVEIDGQVKINPAEIISFHGNEVLKIGKKIFFRIKIES